MSRVLPYNAKQWEIPLLLDGRKTVTRRVIRGKITINEAVEHKITFFPYKPRKDGVKSIKYFTMESLAKHEAPYYPGDILYVRETYKRNMDGYSGIDFGGYIYKTDCHSGFEDLYNPWRPPIHMPKEAARIWLKVTDVRVERLQDITEEGAIKEGLYKGWKLPNLPKSSPAMTARQAFMWIWDPTLKKTDRDRYGWIANPWVWVIGFERCDKPESEG